MKKDSLHVITPDPVKHRDEMLDMTSKVFSRGMGYFGAYAWSRNAYIYNSHYDWNSSCIGLLDGRIVTHFGIWNTTMRIGKARVKVGGVGLVATHADFRKRGLMAQTIRPCLEGLLRNGYDLSLLFGIAGYYDRFGFVPAWNAVEYTIESHRLPKDKPRHRLTRFAPRHRDDLAKLYNRENATRTGTAVRPTFLRNQWPQKWFGYLWKDARGKTAGYVVLSREDEDLQVIDCAGDDRETLAVLSRLVHRLQAKNLVLGGLHYHNPLRKRITRQSYSWARTRYFSGGGPMVLTVNLTSALTKMAGELSGRLKRSHLSGWKGTLLVADAREKVSLVIDRSRVSAAAPVRSKHSIRGSDRLAQLIIGGEDPGEIIEVGKMKLTGQARELVEVLFPHQHPSLDIWDRY